LPKLCQCPVIDCHAFGLPPERGSDGEYSPLAGYVRKVVKLIYAHANIVKYPDRKSRVALTIHATRISSFGGPLCATVHFPGSLSRLCVAVVAALAQRANRCPTGQAASRPATGGSAFILCSHNLGTFLAVSHRWISYAQVTIRRAVVDSLDSKGEFVGLRAFF
jgi:hypothetical protein